MFSINLVTRWLGDLVHLHRMSQADSPSGWQVQQHRIFLSPSPETRRSSLSLVALDAAVHFISRSPAWLPWRGNVSYIASGKLGKEKWVMVSFRSYHMLKWKFNIAQASHTLFNETMAEAGNTKWPSAQPILACFNTATYKNTSLKNEVFETNAIPRECWENGCKLGLSWANWDVQSPEAHRSFSVGFGYTTLVFLSCH